LPAAIANLDAIFPALFVAVVCLIVVSTLTKAPSREHIAQFHGEVA
jgi:hypothetical protein